jgi:hypothetical protein
MPTEYMVISEQYVVACRAFLLAKSNVNIRGGKSLIFERKPSGKGLVAGEVKSPPLLSPILLFCVNV